MFTRKLAKLQSQLGLVLIQATAASLTLSFASVAHADELDNLQRARETAQIRYVNEIGTGKYKSSAQQEELRKNILGPYEQKTRDYFKSISAMPSPRVVKAEEIDLRSGLKKDLSGVGNTSPGNMSQGAEPVKGQSIPTSHGVPASEKSSLRPEFVLDGSNVPKEITFGAPDFKSPK